MNQPNISKAVAVNANKELVSHMHEILKDGRQEVCNLWHKFTWTYWIIVILSICMFLIGIVLVSVPLWKVNKGEFGALESLSTAGVGLLDLTALYFFRPVTRLQRLMGDMGQITIAFSSFQTQVALFLLETDKDDRSTMGRAAQNINKASRNSVELIQRYFEPTERDEGVTSITVEKATQSVRETPQKIREVVTNQIQAQVTGNTNGTA